MSGRPLGSGEGPGLGVGSGVGAGLGPSALSTTVVSSVAPSLLASGSAVVADTLAEAVWIPDGTVEATV